MVVVQEAEQSESAGHGRCRLRTRRAGFSDARAHQARRLEALEENRTKYTPAAGIAPLRQAICDWHARELGSSYQPAECVVNVGGKHAIFNAVCSLINAGDEVIIAAPYWVSYPDIVKYAGGTPVFVHDRRERFLHLRAAQVEAAITPRTGS